MPATLAAFQRWVEPGPAARWPQGPPSRQWLARQPRFSTRPLGLEAVAGLPSARPGIAEERPLPQPQALVPLPAPAAERAGREIISTLRPPGGEGLEEMETRLRREEAAQTLGNEETRAAYMAGELTLAQAQAREDAMWKRADELARLSQERERETEEAARKDAAMVETIAQTLRQAGRDPMTVYQTAWDWVNAGQGPEQLKAFRAVEEEKAERLRTLPQRQAREARAVGEERRAEAREARAAAPRPLPVAPEVQAYRTESARELRRAEAKAPLTNPGIPYGAIQSFQQKGHHEQSVAIANLEDSDRLEQAAYLRWLMERMGRTPTEAL